MLRKGHVAKDKLKKFLDTGDDQDLVDVATTVRKTDEVADEDGVQRLNWHWFKRHIIAGGGDLPLAKKCWRNKTDEDGNKLKSYRYHKQRIVEVHGPSKIVNRHALGVVNSIHQSKKKRLCKALSSLNSKGGGDETPSEESTSSSDCEEDDGEDEESEESSQEESEEEEESGVDEDGGDECDLDDANAEGEEEEEEPDESEEEESEEAAAEAEEESEEAAMEEEAAEEEEDASPVKRKRQGKGRRGRGGRMTQPRPRKHSRSVATPTPDGKKRSADGEVPSARSSRRKSTGPAIPTDIVKLKHMIDSAPDTFEESNDMWQVQKAIQKYTSLLIASKEVARWIHWMFRFLKI